MTTSGFHRVRQTAHTVPDSENSRFYASQQYLSRCAEWRIGVQPLLLLLSLFLLPLLDAPIGIAGIAQIAGAKDVAGHCVSHNERT